MAIDQPLTVLVLCPTKFAPRMANALNAAAYKFQSHCDRRTVSLKFAGTTEDLFSCGGTETDFVAVVVDTVLANNSAECRRQLLKLAPTFTNTRMILLNGSCRSGMRATSKELIDIADHFRIPYMNSEILDDESCKVTAEKILKLASSVCGYETGVPLVIPTIQDFFTS